MLLFSASNMNRKAIAMAIVLVLAGLAPAMAILGFCKRMPCCSHAASDTSIASSNEHGSCCTTITCYDTPSAKLANRSAFADVVVASPHLVSLPSAQLPPVQTHGVVDTSPPATSQQRRPAFAILLI